MTTLHGVRKGDIVHFKSYRLRVEREPERKGNGIRLEGREDRGGCPYVTRWYFVTQEVVQIERQASQ